MYPVATGDSLHTNGQDNFCVQRTLAVLLAQKENPKLSFDALKECLGKISSKSWNLG